MRHYMQWAFYRVIPVSVKWEFSDLPIALCCVPGLSPEKGSSGTDFSAVLGVLFWWLRLTCEREAIFNVCPLCRHSLAQLLGSHSLTIRNHRRDKSSPLDSTAYCHFGSHHLESVWSLSSSKDFHSAGRRKVFTAVQRWQMQSLVCSKNKEWKVVAESFGFVISLDGVSK